MSEQVKQWVKLVVIGFVVVGAVIAFVLLVVVPRMIGGTADFERPINKDITETICDIYNAGDGTVTIYDGLGDVWTGTPRGQGAQ